MTDHVRCVFLFVATERRALSQLLKYTRHEVIVPSRSEPPRSTVGVLSDVEKPADVVPGAKHGSMTAFVNSSNVIAMLLLVARCVDRSLLVHTVRDYSACNFDS